MTEPVELTVEDADSNPVEGANVIIFQENGIMPVHGEYTDATGVISVTLNPGTYISEITKAGFVVAPYSFTVVDNGGGGPTQSFATSGVVHASPTSPDPVGTTLLFGYIVDSAGIPTRRRVVIRSVGMGNNRFVPTTGGTGVDGSLTQVMSEAREVWSDENGYWEALVAQRAVISVSIPDVGFEKKFRVPEGAVLLNVRDARSDPGLMEVGITSDTPATQAGGGA